MAAIDSLKAISDGDTLYDGFFNESNARIGRVALAGLLNSSRAYNLNNLSLTPFCSTYDNVVTGLFATQVGTSAQTGYDYTNTNACLGMRNAYFGTVFDDFVSTSTIAASQLWSTSGTVSMTTTDKGFLTLTSAGTPSYAQSSGSNGINVKTAAGNTELFIGLEYYINTTSGVGSAYNGGVTVTLTDTTNSVTLFSHSLSGASGDVKTVSGYLDLVVVYNKTTNTAYVTKLTNYYSYDDLQGDSIVGAPYEMPLVTSALSSTSLVTNGYLRITATAGASATAIAKVYVVGLCDGSSGDVDVVTSDATLNNSSDGALLYADKRGTITSSISKNGGGAYSAFADNSPINTVASSTAKLKFTGAKPTTITADGTTVVNASVLRGFALLHN